MMHQLLRTTVPVNTHLALDAWMRGLVILILMPFTKIIRVNTSLVLGARIAMLATLIQVRYTTMVHANTRVAVKGGVPNPMRAITILTPHSRMGRVIFHRALDAWTLRQIILIQRRPSMMDRVKLVAV